VRTQSIFKVVSGAELPPPKRLSKNPEGADSEVIAFSKTQAPSVGVVSKARQADCVFISALKLTLTP